MSVKRWYIVSILTGLIIIAASLLIFLSGQEEVNRNFSISPDNYAKFQMKITEPSEIRIYVDVDEPKDTQLNYYCNFYIFDLNNFNKWKKETSFTSFYQHIHIHRESLVHSFINEDDYVVVLANSENSNRIDIRLYVDLLDGFFRLPIRNRIYIAFIPLLLPVAYAIIKRIDIFRRKESEIQPPKGEGDIFDPSDVPPGTIKYCTGCFKEIKIDAKVCPNCGEKIIDM